MACLLLGVAAFGLLQSFVTPVLPTIQHELGTSQGAVTWVMTAYLLSASVCTPIVGRIGDVAGKNRTLVAALLALAAGSAIAALAPNIGVMIGARALQGVGGGVLPLTFGIMRDELPPHRVAGAVGAAAALVAAGSGIGLVLAGPIVDGLGYNWLFWLPFIMVLLAAVAAHRVVPASPRHGEGRPAFGSAALLSVALVLLLLTITEGPKWGWASKRVVIGLVGATAVAVAWGALEMKVREPLVDLRLMAARPVWTVNAVAFLFGAGMYASMTFLPLYLQAPRSTGYGLGASVTLCGLYLLPQAVALIVLGLSAGVLSNRYGSRPVLLVGCLLTVLPFAMMAATPQSSAVIIVASLLFGIGPGLGFSAMTALVVHAVPASRTGVATGMNANIRTMGGAVGAAVMASLVAADGVPSAGEYRDGFLVLTATAVLTVVAAVAVPRRVPVSRPDVMSHPEAAIAPVAPLGAPVPAPEA